VALGAIVAAWLTFNLIIESSGFFTPGNPASYEKNPTMKVNGVACLSVTEVDGRALSRVRERLHYSLSPVLSRMRNTRWSSWLRHCATSRKVAGSIPDGVTGNFH
jgi:hypothetical protein